MEGLSVVAGVFAQDDEALEDGCDGEVLLCGQLRSLAVSQQHRCGVSLETCDGFGFPGLTHHIYSLQHRGYDQNLSFQSWFQSKPDRCMNIRVVVLLYWFVLCGNI